MSAETALETRAIASSRFAGFWRRLGALAVDGFVLMAMGFPLGLLLGERFAPIGTPARLIGLLVIIPYLGLLGSQVGGGQTLGKRLFRLRVVDANGRPLSLARAFVRAALLSFPWIFNGIQFGSMDPVVLAALWVVGILVFGLGGAIIGTYVLNRRTCQALHDLLVGSYVIKADGLGLPIPSMSTHRPMVASMIWIGLVAVVSTAIGVMSSNLMAIQFPPALMESIFSIQGASSLEIKNVNTCGAERPSKVIVAVLWFRGPPEGTNQAAKEVAVAVLRHHPNAMMAQTLTVKVVRGWDVGIASMTLARNYVHTPAQWRAELGL